MGKDNDLWRRPEVLKKEVATGIEMQLQREGWFFDRIPKAERDEFKRRFHGRQYDYCVDRLLYFNAMPIHLCPSCQKETIVSHYIRSAIFHNVL